MDRYGWTTAQAAETLGISEGRVKNRLALLKLIWEAQHLVRNKHLPLGHAEAMQALDKFHQLKALRILQGAKRTPNLSEWTAICGDLEAEQNQAGMFDSRPFLDRPIEPEPPRPQGKTSLSNPPAPRDRRALSIHPSARCRCTGYARSIRGSSGFRLNCLVSRLTSRSPGSPHEQWKASELRRLNNFYPDGKPLSGPDCIARIRQETEMLLLAFSCRTASPPGCRPEHFPALSVLYVPDSGLQFVESLQYFEGSFGTHIIRMPAPLAVPDAECPGRSAAGANRIIEAARLPDFDYDDVTDLIVRDQKLPKSTGSRTACGRLTVPTAEPPSTSMGRSTGSGGTSRRSGTCSRMI
jgi:hypothetical protein